MNERHEPDQMIELGLQGKNVISLPGKSPVIDEGAYVNPYALVIGDVRLERDVSLWPGVIIRADDASVTVREGSAVLDKAFIEAPEGHDVVIGPGALVSHGAIVHGGAVEEGALVGIGAVVLEGARIGRGSIVGAGAVVPPGRVIGDGMLALGIPAKEVRPLTDEEKANTREQLEKVREKASEYGTYYVIGKGML